MLYKITVTPVFACYFQLRTSKRRLKRRFPDCLCFFRCKSIHRAQCVIGVCGKRYAFLTIWDLTLRHCLAVRAPGSGSKKSLSADLAEVCIGWIESGDLVWRVTWFANKEGLAGEGISAPMRFLAETTSRSHREGLEGLIGIREGKRQGIPI